MMPTLVETTRPCQKERPGSLLNRQIRVCYFGTYDRDYHRNRIIINGLRLNGIEVVECHSHLWHSTADKVENVKRGLSLGLIRRLVVSYARLLRNYLRVGEYDVMIVGYAGYFDVFIARVLTALRRKPLIFDAFMSLYDTVVNDRKLASPGSLWARFFYEADRRACQLTDLVLLDTYAHIKFFQDTFNLPASKFRRILIGADDTIHRPLPTDKKDGLFRVIHFGKFIPVHGMEYILQAAKQLEKHSDIRFEMFGSGQLYPRMVALADELGLKNVAWLGWVKLERLLRGIAEADVCLGSFGQTVKANMVVPSKVYVAMAMKKPAITGDSLGAREVLTPKENAMLCPLGDPKALADSILMLKEDVALRQKIAENGYALFKQQCSPEAIGKVLKGYILELL